MREQKLTGVHGATRRSLCVRCLQSTNIAGPIISVWLMGVCILLIFLGIFVSPSLSVSHPSALPR